MCSSVLNPVLHEMRFTTDGGKLMTMGSINVLCHRTSFPRPIKVWRSSSSCATSIRRMVLFPVEDETEPHPTRSSPSATCRQSLQLIASQSLNPERSPNSVQAGYGYRDPCLKLVDVRRNETVGPTAAFPCRRSHSCTPVVVDRNLSHQHSQPLWRRPSRQRTECIECESC